MKKRLWVLLGSIALLGVAFWCLNFRLAASNTQIEKNINTTSIGSGLPNAMQHREKINLVLVGEGPLIAALQKALAVEMKSTGITDLQPVQGIEPKYQSPVLIVKVGKPGLLWTPFFATSHFTIQAGYSSAGDTTFMGKTPVIMDNLDGSALNMWGEYKVSDHSLGLISRPGYYRALAENGVNAIRLTLFDPWMNSQEKAAECPMLTPGIETP